MKKLMFALAGTAAFAALAADPAARTGDISIVGFENYTADQTVIGYADDGTAGASLWSATGDDASLVKTYGGDNAAAPAGLSFPAPFENAGDKYLALDTNGSELQRAIPAAGQAVAADGTYIDTLVQFTPSESAPTEADLAGAKLAVWLGVVNNETNLYVQGAYYESADGESISANQAQAYKLNKACKPGQWYRLTVKAYGTIGNAAATDGGTYLPAFSILVDGVEVTTSAAVYSQAALEYLCPSEGAGSAEDNYLDADMLAALKAGKIIPSLDAALELGTLTAVGFKGTGALDDFVVTTVAPEFTPEALDFLVTLSNGNQVPIQPTAADLDLFEQLGYDTSDRVAVNAALDSLIPGTSVPTWQALFLGLEPTATGLEAFKIDSISFNAADEVVLTLPAALSLKTGRGLDITLNILGSDDLGTWASTPLATATNTTVIPPIAPAQGEAKKFYKATVDFAASPAQE